MSLYCASKTKHAWRWRQLRSSGVQVISTWIDEAEAGQTSDFADLWIRCVKEAAEADWLLVYREPEEILKGAFIEVGAALVARTAVIAVGCDEFSWTKHPMVLIKPDLESALAFIRKTTS